MDNIVIVETIVIIKTVVIIKIIDIESQHSKYLLR